MLVFQIVGKVEVLGRMLLVQKVVPFLKVPAL
jgi:hypothetical protein